MGREWAAGTPGTVRRGDCPDVWANPRIQTLSPSSARRGWLATVSTSATFDAAGVITLLTDFGLDDPFVGVMKGVILSLLPRAQIVDLTHAIPAQDIDAGAFWLERSFRYFPAGTVHIAVVDPGVGSERGALVTESCGHCFVAPDNGLLAPVLRQDADAASWAIDLARLALPTPSMTFHGRDVFAPIGARLACGGLKPSDLGASVEPVANTRHQSIAPPRSAAQGTVVIIDHFGNLITNISGREISLPPRPSVETCGRRLPLVRTYSDVARGELMALINSFDRLEIACRDGSAAATLGAHRGTMVRVVRSTAR